MKLALLAMLLAAPLAHADYHSAAARAAEAARARNAQWLEERARTAQAAERAALAAVVRRHGGYAYGPTQVPSRDGAYSVTAFGTRDGWECEAFAGELKCAHAGQGKKFKATRWIGGRKNLSVYTGSWDYTDLLSAGDFFGYRRPRTGEMSLGF